MHKAEEALWQQDRDLCAIVLDAQDRYDAGLHIVAREMESLLWDRLSPPSQKLSKRVLEADKFEILTKCESPPMLQPVGMIVRLITSYLHDHHVMSLELGYYMRLRFPRSIYAHHQARTLISQYFDWSLCFDEDFGAKDGRNVMSENPVLGKAITTPRESRGLKIGAEVTTQELTLDMQLGIRYTVGRCEAAAKPTLTPADFGEVSRLKFPSAGSKLTPSHKQGDFTFNDYAPHVFRHIRRRFGVDAAFYQLSVCGEFQYLEFQTNSKSGEFFFFSHDNKYMIKTVSSQEAAVLMKMLPKYFAHTLKNPHTLLTRFYGLHRVKPSASRMHYYFLIMGSVFHSGIVPDLVFDLKGSLVGRSSGKNKASEEAKRNGPHSAGSRQPKQWQPPTVYKDKDFIDAGRRVLLPPKLTRLFHQQIRRDVGMLKECNVMDYSLLVGVVDRKAASSRLEALPPVKSRRSRPSFDATSSVNAKAELAKEVPKAAPNLTSILENAPKSQELGGPTSAPSPATTEAPAQAEPVVSPAAASFSRTEDGTIPEEAKETVEEASSKTAQKTFSASNLFSPLSSPAMSFASPLFNIRAFGSQAALSPSEDLTERPKQEARSRAGSVLVQEAAPMERYSSAMSLLSPPMSASRTLETQEWGPEEMAILEKLDDEPLESAFERTAGGTGSLDRKEIYYFGIIDFLVEYGIKKKTETFLKTNVLRQERKQISSIDPEKYAERFCAFLTVHSGASDLDQSREGAESREEDGLSAPHPHDSISRSYGW